MAYAKRAQIEYKDINDIDTRAEIWTEGYAGAVTYRDYANGEVATELKYGDSSRKQYPTVYGSKATLYFDAEADYEFLDFFTSDSRKNKILIYKNEGLFHVSFAEADSWSESLRAAPYEVSLTGYDGLGLLKDEDFLDENKDPYEGELTPLEILQLILEKTGLALEFNTAVSVRPDGAGTGADALTQVTKDVAAYEGLSCYDVLEQLFQGCRIFQRGGQWWVISNDKWTGSAITCYHYTAAGTASGTVNFNTEFGGWWMEGEGSLGFLPALKQMLVKQDYGFKDNILPNGEFTKWNNVDGFEDWTRVGLYAQLKQLTNDGDRFCYVPGGEDVPYEWRNELPWRLFEHTRYMYSQPITVKATSAIPTVSIEFAFAKTPGTSFNPQKMFFALFLDAGATTYTLQPFLDVDNTVFYQFTVSTAPNNVPLKSYVRKYNNGDYEIKPEVVEPHDLPSILDFFETQTFTVRDGIPEDGDLYLYLYQMDMVPDNTAGACYKKATIKFTDENDEDLPTDAEFTLVNSLNNNYVPDDIELVNGDIPGFENNLVIYDGGFKLLTGEASSGWTLDGTVVNYTYSELVARLVASQMQYARQKYSVRLADSIPSTSMVIVDANNSNKRLIEMGITYNDRMQTIEGTYAEVKAIDLTVFTILTKENYDKKNSSSGSSGSKVYSGTPVPATVDEKVRLMNSDFLKVEGAGFLSAEEFVAIEDINTHIIRIFPRYVTVFNEVPAGVIDGVNKTYTLEYVPYELMLNRDGKWLIQDKDYTTDPENMQFTLRIAPSTRGSYTTLLRAFYKRDLFQENES